jgi:hypothetical protein
MKVSLRQNGVGTGLTSADLLNEILGFIVSFRRAGLDFYHKLVNTRSPKAHD